ncbi:Hypothetical predicted protein [Mytilus galloprovincialis]|uniref:Uncharacterized protein n=1 Tax=Mytilus galloprovincialis TaxID=29158 RepID=A0A8B6BYS3_MYTGA|nr:Hypothetical predicted protein [Mytilus galloprovincialis]
MKFKISMMILLLVILKAMPAAEPVNPCPNELEHIVVDMCTDDSAIEDSVDGSKTVDSVLLRITKQKNNCICYVSLQNAATNYKIYMSKYDLLSNSAPEQSNCGLAVDVDYVDTSDITRSLQSINCTHGTGVRSIALGGNELIFKSRIIPGDFSRGYCMQIYRNQAIFICKMNDQIGYSGSDVDWITAYRTKNTSVEECKQYCMQTKACVAVHYEHNNNYCFVYNTTTVLHYRDNTTYSQKHCMDTQKLRIKCYSPESTTQPDQATSRENTFTANLETITNPISDKQVTVSTTQSSIEKEKENIKGLAVIGEKQCNNGVSVLNVCICHHGWTGSDCSIDVDECSRVNPSPCGERGACVNTPGSYHCDCKQSYVGVNYEHKLHGSIIRKRLVLNSFATPPAPHTTVLQTTNSPPPFTTRAPPTPHGIKTPQPITEQQVSQGTITTKAPPPIG